MVDRAPGRVAYQAAAGPAGPGRDRRNRRSHRQVAALAAQEYEAGGGFGPMAAMLGNSGGPQAFLNGAAAGQQLAQQGTDVLVAEPGDEGAWPGCSGRRRRRALDSEQAAARRARRLKAGHPGRGGQPAGRTYRPARPAPEAAGAGSVRPGPGVALQQARQRALAAAAGPAAGAAAGGAQRGSAATAVRIGGCTPRARAPAVVLGLELSLDQARRPARATIGRRLGAQPDRQALPMGRGRAVHLRLLGPGHGGLGARRRAAAALDRLPVAVRAAHARSASCGAATCCSTPRTTPTRPPSTTSGSTSATADGRRPVHRGGRPDRQHLPARRADRRRPPGLTAGRGGRAGRPAQLTAGVSVPAASSTIRTMTRITAPPGTAAAPTCRASTRPT